MNEREERRQAALEALGDSMEKADVAARRLRHGAPIDDPAVRAAQSAIRSAIEAVEGYNEASRPAAHVPAQPSRAPRPVAWLLRRLGYELEWETHTDPDLGFRTARQKWMRKEKR